MNSSWFTTIYSSPHNSLLNLHVAYLWACGIKILGPDVINSLINHAGKLLPLLAKRCHCAHIEVLFVWTMGVTM